MFVTLIGLSGLRVYLAPEERFLSTNEWSFWFSSIQNPSYGVSVLTEWRGALDDSEAFAILLRASWLPTIRRAVMTEWDPHDCGRLLDVFEAWKSLLPEDFLQQELLDALVLSRLRVRTFPVLL